MLINVKYRQVYTENQMMYLRDSSDKTNIQRWMQAAQSPRDSKTQ